MDIFLFTEEVEDDDYFTHPTYISTDHKILMAKQMTQILENASRILSSPTAVTQVDKRYLWLALCSGDLEGREFRPFISLDLPQIQQIHEYVSTILCIPLPPFHASKVDLNIHLWKLFSAHKTSIYRTSNNDMVNESIIPLWKRYDAEFSQLKEKAKDMFHEEFEELYFERGFWIASSELSALQKSMTIHAKRTHNPVKAFVKLEKLFGYHGKRKELTSVYNEWIFHVITSYGPSWLNEVMEKCKSRPSFPGRDKLEEIVNSSDDHYNAWISHAVSNPTVFTQEMILAIRTKKAKFDYDKMIPPVEKPSIADPSDSTKATTNTHTFSNDSGIAASNASNNGDKSNKKGKTFVSSARIPRAKHN